MYFPLLRGKQFELIALRELLENNLLSTNITPIIEPIRATSTFKSVLMLFKNKNRAIAVIQNPAVVEYQPFNDTEVTELKQLPLFYPAQLIHSSADLYELGKFDNPKKMAIITKDDNPDIDGTDKVWQDSIKVIAVGQRLLQRSKGDRVELREAVKSRPRNVDYKENSDEFFSEDHQYFSQDGYFGFGDYSVIGTDYKDTGFAPFAVAIHIVYFNDKGQLRIRHFVSDSNDDFHDPAKKFAEALNHLVEWYESEDIADTRNDSSALTTFVKMHHQEIYSGLGVVKKLSIQHHFEIIGQYLDGGD